MSSSPENAMRRDFEASALPCLVADIGGSNARFACAVAGRVSHVRTLAVTGYGGPVEAAQAYLNDLAAELGPAFSRPRRAAFAVATALDGDEVDLINSSWRFSSSEVQRQLGLDVLLMLNDFEALALSLPGLQPSQLRAHGVLPKPRACWR